LVRALGNGAAAALCVALATGWVVPVQAQEDTAVGLSAVRFYRAPAGQTLVQLFCRIPLAGLTPLAGVRGQAAYRVGLSVRDSSGLELLHRSWAEMVDASLASAPGATGGVHFQFAVPPGRYLVDATVADSGSGRVRGQQVGVRAFAAAPEVSDLLAAQGLRRGEASDTTPRAGEFRMGSLFLETSGWTVATPERAQVGYYLELYAARAETVSVGSRVLDAAGKQLAAAAPQQVSVPRGGGATSQTLDLSGLPPGDYRLLVDVRTPDSAVLREAAFTMTGFGRGPGAVSGPGAEIDSLVRLSEAQLDSMYGPLEYLLDPTERGVYPGLTVDGKRTFLRAFWVKRDPTPGTARNEFEETFYRTVRDAGVRFRERGGSAVPGWHTDRGRIFIVYGAPDEVLDRGQAGSSRPYQVWKYTGRKAHRFIFLDTTSSGSYVLIWTDERREPSRPDWQELLGPEALDDALRF